MLFRDEMSERICNARTVTERKENRTLREKGVFKIRFRLRVVHQQIPRRYAVGGFFLSFRNMASLAREAVMNAKC